MKSSLQKLALTLVASSVFLSAPLALAQAQGPTPPAIDVSKLSPEQKAIYDKLTPAQQKTFLTPPPLPQGIAPTGDASASAQPTDASAPTASSATGSSMYILVGIGVLIVIGLGSFLARRKNMQGGQI